MNSARRRLKSPRSSPTARRWKKSPMWSTSPRRAARSIEIGLPDPGRDHQGQPERRHRRRLDLQGRGLPGRQRPAPLLPATKPLHESLTLRFDESRGVFLNVFCRHPLRRQPERRRIMTDMTSNASPRPRACVRTRTNCTIPQGDRNRYPHARHDRRAAHHLARPSHHVRRALPDAAQSLEPVGPDIIRGDHGDGHGAGHRHAQHRPFGRLGARRGRHDHGLCPGAFPAA